MRLLVQDVTSGRFLVPSLDGGEPEWTNDLRKAGGGVFTDPEQAIQLVEDNMDFGHQLQVVDLDRLGTVNDYVG